MPLRHWVAAAQLAASGLPQRPSAAQTPASHWAPLVQSVPAGRRGAQLPALQKLLARHSESLTQVVPQVPLLQAPSRHWVGAVQAPLAGVPQRWSAAQTPEAQAALRVQGDAAARRGAQAPVPVPGPGQKSEAAQSPSPPQSLAQTPWTQAPLRQSRPPRHEVPSVAPHLPSAPQTPELHWVPEVQGWMGGAPLGAASSQVRLTASQYVPETHWALLAQVAEQLPVTSSQISLWHCAGALQGCPVGTPQVPATQKAEAHWLAAVQLTPLPWRGAQVPPEQKSAATHWLSAVQVGPHTPEAQAPARQATGVVQLPPSGAPHFPSPPHTPAAHIAALVQAAPLGRPARQRPEEQKVPPAHSASAVQVRLQVPPLQAPVRQVAGEVQTAPWSSPHTPSVAQVPERHSVAAAQGPPVGVPQRPSTPQRPLRQAAPVLQLAPWPPPHLPSVSQRLLRQVSGAAQAPPLPVPHLPSRPQTPLRQLSAVPQGLPLLEPQTPSLSQTLERHWLSLPQVPPLTASATQAWAASQKLPATQSALLAQTLEQVLAASQMPERQSKAPAQGPPSGTPHLPSGLQAPETHWAGALQAPPLGRDATQVPAPQ
jgi:hypothetical protein